MFEEAFADFAKIGYSAVKADVPDGMEAQEYLDWIGSYGLAPAISLFNSPFDETIDITEEVERAKRFAGTQVALGLDRTMISSMAIPARMAQPAVGADFSRDRLNLAIENCGMVCQVLQAEGLRPLHHSHVGGVFETEEEIVTLLDELGSGLIGFGPDTGHLRWAGIEPASMIKRYADRLGGIHIKDVFPTISALATVTPKQPRVPHTMSSPPPNVCGASPGGESSTSKLSSRHYPRITTATS